MRSHLQTDKLIPIDLPEICAPRPELLRHFDKAAGKRCIYVGAPAGCGKTVSALLWIQKSGCKAVWMGLDEYDNAPAAFYRFFCKAFFSVIVHEESLSEIIKGPAFNGSPVEYTMEVLARLSFDEKSRYVLVLDDFHFITHEEIFKSLTYILKRLPLSVTVLLLSRNAPPAFLSPLEESGKVAFIGALELAFKGDEIRRFFASYGRFITEKEADQIFSLTEGWAIAVGALALSGNVTAGGEIKRGLLDQFIEAQIWNKFDEDLRRFMIQTAVVDEFSVTLAAQLSQSPKAESVLEMLCKGNLFISRQDNEYRYHHLFLDFLRGRPAFEAQLQQEALYRKAAEYYLEHEDCFNALRYFIKSGDGKGMAAALYGFLECTGQSSEEMLKLYFIKDLPADVLEQNPFLYIVCVYCSFLFSDAKSTYYYFDRLYDRIFDIEQEHKEFLESIFLLFTIDPRYSLAEQMDKFQLGATFGAKGNHLPKAMKSLSHNLTYFHRTFRDFCHYALNMEEFAAEFRRVFFTLLGDHYPLIESGVRSGLLYEKNLLKEAVTLVASDPATDSAELAFMSKMQIAACLFAMGKEEEAARCRAEIKSFLKEENLLYVLPAFSAYETKIKLLDGDKAAAAAWFDNYFVTGEQNPELHKVFIHFTTIRAYIVLGEFNKAHELCEKIKTLARDFGRFLGGIEATVLLTLIKWITGKKQEAASLLQTALTSAEPYHFIRVFADEGKAILPILKKLLKKTGNERERVLSCKYAQEVYLAAYEHARRHKGMACFSEYKPVKLSKQQKYVLELLAKGHKNAEIIELSGLSINTIRSHTKVVYQKLEVNNVMDAVLRAKELGLIE